MSARCKGCGAAIVWAKTVNGKAIPLDAKPERRQVYVLDADNLILAGLTDVDDGVETTVRSIPTYMPHHATCKNVDQFRKQR